MGTKQNPGSFACYDAALPDEPMFVLLARDLLAPMLTDLWAAIRSGDEDSARAAFGMALGTGRRLYAGNLESEKAGEAYDCANEMRSWRLSNDGAWRHPRPAADLKQAGFRSRFHALNVNLPLQQVPGFPGVVFDSSDRQVLIVDNDAERPDDEAEAIASLVLMAVNGRAGLSTPSEAGPGRSPGPELPNSKAPLPVGADGGPAPAKAGEARRSERDRHHPDGTGG